MTTHKTHEPVSRPDDEIIEAIERELADTRKQLAALNLIRLYENTPVPDVKRTVKSPSGRRGTRAQANGLPASVADVIYKAGSGVPRKAVLTEQINTATARRVALEAELARWQEHHDAWRVEENARHAAEMPPEAQEALLAELEKAETMP